MARFNILTFTKYDNLHISIKTEWVQNSIFQIGTILPNLVTILDEKNQLLIFGRNESLYYSYPSNENKGKMILVLPTLTFQFWITYYKIKWLKQQCVFESIIFSIAYSPLIVVFSQYKN